MEKYTSNIITPKISIAPMVDKSHRHFRYFCRLMNKDILLYTEMVTAQAIIKFFTLEKMREMLLCK